MTITFDSLEPSGDGLIPAVVQHAADGTVLMVGYMDREAFDRTVESGSVHFWSRSRSRLWMKGETSGNTLTLVSITADCDSDSLLVTAFPAGPTCHTGTDSCFGSRRESLGAIIDELVAVIDERRVSDAGTSYTASLIADGSLAARKVLEEAGEVAFAAKDRAAGTDTADHVAEEAADVIYHLLALLAASDVPPGSVAEVLRNRRR